MQEITLRLHSREQISVCISADESHKYCSQIDGAFNVHLVIVIVLDSRKERLEGLSSIEKVW